MIKKCINPGCNKEFEPKSAKGVYCSVNCKSKHQYFLKKEGLTQPTIEYKQRVKDAPNPWISIIDKFCEKEGLNPEDLVKWYKSAEMSPKPPERDEKPYPSNWAEMGRIEKLKWLTANQ